MTVSTPIAWDVVEKAIQDWFEGVTDLKTIWRNQSGTQPRYPYASLLVIAGPTQIGQLDDYRYTTQLTQPVGQEVLTEVCGLREMTVSCQVYVDKYNGANDPLQNAKYYMTIAQSSLNLPSVLADLRVAGLSVVEAGSVENLDEIMGEAYLSRANMDVRFYLTSLVSERTGYIKTAEISSPLGLDDEIYGDTT